MLEEMMPRWVPTENVNGFEICPGLYRGTDFKRDAPGTEILAESGSERFLSVYTG